MAPQKTDLDAEALESLLTRLDRDSGEAGKKYLQLRDKLARHCFKKHEFLRADELADQTLNVLAKKLSSKEEHIDKPEPYAFTILDNLLLANIRGRKMVLLPENFPGGDNPEGTVIEKMDGEKKFKCVLQCLDRLSPEEMRQFGELNDAYRSRFGFPFIMAVKGKSKAEILAAFQHRLANDAGAETRTALAEIDRIAALRLKSILP